MLHDTPLVSRSLAQCQRSAPLSCRGFVYMLVSVCKRAGRWAWGGRRVRGGGDVSSLTSILPLAWCCVESMCKSHVITPPPRTRVLGMRGRAEQPQKGRRRERFAREEGGGGLDMFLYKCPACISQTKAPPSRFLPHFCLLCLFSFSPCCLSL